MGDTEEKASTVTEETAQTSQEATVAPSKQAVKPSEETAEVHGITKTPEFQKAWREEQSRRDKESKGLRDRLDQLEKERQADKDARAAAERQRSEEAKVNEIYEGLKEEGISEANAASWRDRALAESRRIAKEAADHADAIKKSKEEWDSKTAELTGKELKLVIADVVEEAEKQGKYFSHSDAKEIAEKSKGNLDVIKLMVEHAPLAKEESEEEEDTRPGTSLPSTPGGVNISKLSGKELLRRGFAKSKNK